MQLQQSVFSLHNAFIRKSPLCIWVSMLVIISVILMFQTFHYATQPQSHQFSECFYEYYKMTRPVQNQQTTTNNSKINVQNDFKNQTIQTEIKQKEDPKLTSQYYKLFNHSTITKLYVSEDVKYVGNSAKSCRILLNNPQSLINNQTNNTVVNDIKKQQQKNSDAFYFDDKNHPTLHLSGNQHLISLDFNDKEFKKKHQIIEHVIILPRESLQEIFPTFLGISSKYWRFYTKQQLSLNQNLLYTIGKSLKKLQQKIQKQYEDYLKNKLNESQQVKTKEKSQQNQPQQQQQSKNKQNDKKQNNLSDQNKIMKTFSQQKKTNLKEKNLLKIDDDTKSMSQKNNEELKENSKLIKINNDNEDKNLSKDSFSIDKFLLSVLVSFPQLSKINVVNQLILYYHVSGVTYQEKISSIIQSFQSMSFIGKILMFFIMIIPIIILSIIVGLFVRYLFISLLTAYLFLGGCWINQQWGWVFQYFNIIRKRVQQNRNASLLSSCKMTIHFTVAMIGTYLIMTLGIKHIIDMIWIHSLAFNDTYYSQMFIKNIFIIELFHFISCRSRTSIRFYPLFSILITVFILYSYTKCFFCNTTWLLNLHMWMHLILFFSFAIIQNLIGNFEADEQYMPSLQKPRALYYAGYDISWQNSLPPVWTYFTRWFDLSHFGRSQKSLINKDYRLLYGKMLGMNQEEQLPQQGQFQMQEQIPKFNQLLSESNNQSGLLK